MVTDDITFMRDSMYLVKSKNSPYYQVIYFRKGKKTSKSTRKKRKSEALKFLSEFRQNIAKKEVIPEVKISQYHEQYKELMSRGHSLKYIRSIDLSFKMLKEFTGDIYISQITRPRAEDFISFTYKRSKHAARLYNRTLKAAFNKAIDNWNYIEDNPFRKIKIPKIPEKLPVFITESEFISLLENTEDEMMKDIFTVAFYTGMRLSEITHLTWDNIDFNNKQIVVKNTDTFTTKSKKERIIPMFSKVQDILHKYELKKTLQYYPIFYRILGIKLRGEYISKRFKRAVEESGLQGRGIHFHSLRHSFASNLVRKGVPIIVVKELLGHASISTTQIYSHVRREDLVEAVGKFESIEGDRNNES